MARLGYDRYGAQGGDWGSAVTTSLGGRDAAHCAGIHITLAMGGAAGGRAASRRRRRRGRSMAIKYYADWDLGYSKQQATRPQTLGYGLTDSPAGQAAWSSRSSGPGRTATAIPRTSSGATSCSTT